MTTRNRPTSRLVYTWLLGVFQGVLVGMIVMYKLNPTVNATAFVLFVTGAVLLQALLFVPDIYCGWKKFRAASGMADEQLRAECQPGAPLDRAERGK
jgi:heme A synthase